MNESIFANELLENLSLPMLWKYRMFVLNKSKEEITKTQVFLSLKEYLASIGNFSQTSFIEKVRQKDYNGPIIYRNAKEEQQLEQKSLNREIAIYKRYEKEIDYSVTASAQVRQLKFWNALQNYKRDIRLRSSKSKCDKYYEQRAQLHLVLDEYRKAFCLARKASSYELIVVTSFVESDFRKVIELFEDAVMQIENTPVTAVTRFELMHMIGFSFLAKWNFNEDDNELFDEFMSYISEEKKYENLKNSLIQFKERKYVEALKSFNEIGKFYYISVYMSISWNDLIAEIHKNVVAHCVRPYYTLSIQEISQQTGLSRIDLPMILSEAIGDGLISGKVDICAKTYTSSPRENPKQQKEIVDSAENLIAMVKVGFWKLDASKQIQKNMKHNK